MGKKGKVQLKVPKGTCDLEPFDMTIRERVFKHITACFKRHGAVTINTPVFELKETLTGKYGEDSKLIYDLVDQGGEICALRYDLTVPFARYCVMHSVRSIKRYHIGRVYRRDAPSRQRGRLREFYQCDFDIAGVYPPMIPDAEVLKVLTEILDGSGVGEYRISLNHRKLLDGMFEVCGVPEDKFRAICSSVDKLDKLPWEQVKTEMVEKKGLPEEVADRIHDFVVLRGEPRQLLQRLTDENLCQGNANCESAFQDLRTLFGYLEAYQVLDKVRFDLSLARGLDYYTGVIFEAVLTDGTQRVGSIAGGGRYDDLIGMFGNRSVPAIGVSVGIERLFAILEKKMNKQETKVCPTEVLVCSIDGLLQERMAIVNELWSEDISAEFVMKAKPKLQPQLSQCETNKIRWALIFGENELEKGELQLKDMNASRENPIVHMVPRENVARHVKRIMEEAAAQEAP